MARDLTSLSLGSRSLGSVGQYDVDTDVLDLTSLGGGESLRGPYTGTHALMLAVLDNGITCYLSRTPRIRAEAEHWFATAEHTSPFSFLVICDTLGLEPSAVRRALVKMRALSGVRRPSTNRRRPNVRREGRLLVSRRR